jgi:hypothetical protein
LQPNKHFESFVDRCRRAAEILCTGFAASGADLDICYRESLKVALKALAALMLWGRGRIIAKQSFNLHDLISRAQSTGISIFGLHPQLLIGQSDLETGLRALLEPTGVSAVEPADLYFHSLPLGWLGRAYEQMLALTPVRANESVAEPGSIYLTAYGIGRRRRGAYFTPDFLVDYTVRATLQPLLYEGAKPLRISVLDPSTGGGDFLLGAIRFLAHSAGMTVAELCREKVRRGTICGVDNDPLCVHIARFLIAASAELGPEEARALDKVLVYADSLSLNQEDWWSLFPHRLPAGFHAVVGNPPYVAAKSSLSKAPAGGKQGQHDLYLRFLRSVTDNDLVRRGGSFAMVLPDPFLIRGNGSEMRRRLFGGWETLSMLHIASAFEEVGVANVVPVWRNRKAQQDLFPVYRIERVAERRQLEKTGMPPKETELQVSAEVLGSRPGAEMLYLLADERYRRVVEAVQERDGRLKPGFALLAEFTERIFRGEEIGKKAISGRSGRFKMLMGGQSVQSYRVAWEGYRTDALGKPEEYYLGPKILVQKSAPRLVAALDTEDHAFPQSVYAIRLRPDTLDPYFLLALLNSRFLNDYLFATSTGYKLLQPQIEIHDLRELPIPTAEDPTLADLSKRISDMLSENLVHPDTEALRSSIDKLTERLYLG